MSDKQRDPEPIQQAAASEPAREDRTEDPAPGTQPEKPVYVFKIVSANPKHAFDFEDVADK